MRTILYLAIVALIAASSCSSSDSSSDSGSELPADVEAVIEGFLTAFANQDEQAMRPLVTDDFKFGYNAYRHDGSTPAQVELYEVIEDDLEGVIAVGFTYEWSNEVTGEYIATGEGPWIVSQPENWYWRDSTYGGIGIYVVVDEADEKKIASYGGAFELTKDSE